MTGQTKVISTSHPRHGFSGLFASVLLGDKQTDDISRFLRHPERSLGASPYEAEGPPASWIQHARGPSLHNGSSRRQRYDQDDEGSMLFHRITDIPCKYEGI